MGECPTSGKEDDLQSHHRSVSSVSTNEFIASGDSTSELSCGATTMPSSPEAATTAAVTLSHLTTSSAPPAPIASNGVTPAFHGLSALLEAATSQLEHLANVAASQLNEGHVEDVNDANDANDGDDDSSSRDAIEVDECLVASRTDGNASSSDAAVASTEDTFPLRLLRLCLDPANADTITFLPDGKFFAVRQSSFCALLSQVMTESTDETCHRDEGSGGNFADFVQLAEQWGFSRIGSAESEAATSARSALNHDILVFRHPNFVANDMARCRLVRYGDSPETVRLHALPSHNRINVVLSENTSPNGPPTQSKRRLSPGFLNRRDDAVSSTTTRQRVDSDEAGRRRSERSQSLEENDLILTDTSNTTPELVSVTKQRQRHSLPATLPHEPLSSSIHVSATTALGDYYTNDHARSMALSITSERLKLTTHRPSTGTTAAAAASTTTLVETAVTSCTHDIVTDAIESLLRDARHSKELYRKHEKELSKSSLPGVIPVCKHIFAPSKGKAGHVRTRSDGGVPMRTSLSEARSSLQTLARIVTQDQAQESEDHDKTSDIAASTARPLLPLVVPEAGTTSEVLHRNRSGLQRTSIPTLKPTSPLDLDLGARESL